VLTEYIVISCVSPRIHR